MLLVFPTQRTHDLKELSFYEQSGIVLPGAGLLLGVLVLEPAVQPIFLGDGLTVGGLGLFVIIAYALGHLCAAVGNVIDTAIWFVAGGMPSQWPRDPERPLIGAAQRTALLAKMKARTGTDFDPTTTISKKEWRSAFHVVYRDVLGSGLASRVEVFNGSYGLNRGLAAAAVMLIPLVLQKWPEHAFWWIGALLFMSAVYAFRMFRFGVHFAREVFIRFLLLPDDRA